MLAAFGVVEGDREDGTVRYRPDEQLEAVLDSLPEGAVETKSRAAGRIRSGSVWALPRPPIWVRSPSYRPRVIDASRD